MCVHIVHITSSTNRCSSHADDCWSLCGAIVFTIRKIICNKRTDDFELCELARHTYTRTERKAIKVLRLPILASIFLFVSSLCINLLCVCASLSCHGTCAGIFHLSRNSHSRSPEMNRPYHLGHCSTYFQLRWINVVCHFLGSLLSPVSSADCVFRLRDIGHGTMRRLDTMKEREREWKA